MKRASNREVKRERNVRGRIGRAVVAGAMAVALVPSAAFAVGVEDAPGEAGYGAASASLGTCDVVGMPDGVAGVDAVGADVGAGTNAAASDADIFAAAWGTSSGNGMLSLLGANTTGMTEDGWAWSANGTSVVLTGYSGSSLAPAVPAQVDGLPVSGAIVNAGAGAPSITSIDVSACASTLKSLKVRGCALSSLDLSACTNLTLVDVSSNALGDLNVAGLASLERLICQDNKLVRLDLTGLSSLTSLNCQNNLIETLDLRTVALLEWAQVNDNRLTSLSVNANTRLNDLYAYNNLIPQGAVLNALTSRYGTDQNVILPQGEAVSMTGATAVVLGGPFEATGDPITPKLVVKLGGKTLVEGTDYTVAYYNNVAPGTGLAVVTGLGSYLGSKGFTFTIDNPGSGGEAIAFDDVSEGEWFYDAVQYVAKRGLITGYAGTQLYGPSHTLTRAQAAIIFWRYFDPEGYAAYDQSTAVNTTNMPDVESGTWYTGAANWAVSVGVINGKGEGADRIFDPDGAITREQLCRIIANAATVFSGADVTDADASDLTVMPDATDVSDWATQSVTWCLSKKVISGVNETDGRYVRPGMAVDRATMAQMMMNTIEGGVL